ncbi:MAG: hypothetical protein AAGN66_23970 [Acidobacteriota bacterium]
MKLKLLVVLVCLIGLAAPSTLAAESAAERIDIGRMLTAVVDFLEVLVLGDTGPDELGPFAEPSGDDLSPEPDSELGPLAEPGGDTELGPFPEPSGGG